MFNYLKFNKIIMEIGQPPGRLIFSSPQPGSGGLRGMHGSNVFDLSLSTALYYIIHLALLEK
jgi:hypothetical protein